MLRFIHLRQAFALPSIFLFFLFAFAFAFTFTFTFTPAMGATVSNALAQEAPRQEPLAQEAPRQEPLAQEAPRREPLPQEAPRREPEDAAHTEVPLAPSPAPTPHLRPYGGLTLTGAFEPAGSGNELERGCADLGAASCSTPIPIGAALFAHFGFARGPLGLEAMIGGMGDLHRPSARFDGVTHVPHGNPLVAEPARTESFILLRGAALFALRGRYTFEPARPAIRASLAAGVGLAYRYAALEREVKSDSGLEDRPYFPSGSGYVSPALNLDASFAYRATPTLAIAFGVFVWLDSAGGGVRSDADPKRILAGEGGLAPVATPAYRMTSGAQLFVGPYVGLQFGP